MKACVSCVCTQGTELTHDMAVSAACCLCFVRELRKFNLFKFTRIEIYTNTTQGCIAASTWGARGCWGGTCNLTRCCWSWQDFMCLLLCRKWSCSTVNCIAAAVRACPARPSGTANNGWAPRLRALWHTEGSHAWTKALLISSAGAELKCKEDFRVAVISVKVIEVHSSQWGKQSSPLPQAGFVLTQRRCSMFHFQVPPLMMKIVISVAHPPRFPEYRVEPSRKNCNKSSNVASVSSIQQTLGGFLSA